MNSRQVSRTKILVRYVVIVAGIIILGLAVPKVFSFIGEVALSPYHTARQWVLNSGSSLPQYLRDRSVLIEQIEDLKKEVATEKGTELSMRKLINENASLRELLATDGSDRIAARVIARPNSLPYDLIQIDQGSKDGIVRLAPVFLGRDQVIGYITHVSREYSFVQLVTTPGFASTVFIVGPDIYTNAEGMGGGVMRVRVPQGVSLKKGNLVLLPAVNSGVYGEIISVEAIPTQPQQYGYLSPNIPLQSMRYVAVGTEPIVTPTFEEVQNVITSKLESLFVVVVPEDQLVDETSTSSATSTEENE
ncbi:rod shape-determining protein MreC [Candidatus Kaiserbacteria bacterium]|nr:rod shape-determining protein MreC [Candidatus Kaiserbacteria bacterium]